MTTGEGLVAFPFSISRTLEMFWWAVNPDLSGL